MRKPLFSVIIPTLNEEKFLPRLLTSLTKQTAKDFEVIVVDGSSKDRTVALARSFTAKLPRLSVLVSPTANLPLQRNLGAKSAKGSWLVFVDADGEFLPYFVDRCRTYIESYKPSFFSTWWRADSDEYNDALLALLANITQELTLVFKRPHAPGPLTIVSRHAFDRVGGYDEEHTFTEDLDFGLRLGQAGFTSSLLRETPYVWSLRRLRKEGTLKVGHAYAKAAAMALFMRKAPKSMPGYIMGGQLYKKQKSVKRSLIRQYEQRLKQLMKELFE